MHWTTDILGLEYIDGGRNPKEGLDCLGLYLLAYQRRFGVALPDPQCSAVEAIRRYHDPSSHTNAEKVSDPREGDALVFRMGTLRMHMAFRLDDSDMLHIDTGNTSNIARYNTPHWGSRLIGIYRYVP